MDTRSEISNRFTELYRENIDKINGISSPYINTFRKSAIEKYNSLGVPSRKNEAYRYTNLDIFFKHDYGNYFIPLPSDFVKAEKFRCDIDDLDTHGLVFLNGFYPTLIDKLRQLPSGVWIGSLNEAARKFPDLIEKHYGKYAGSETDGLIHLNTAMASDGVFVYVPAQVVPDKHVQVVNLVDSDVDMLYMVSYFFMVFL
jgi:Fe-S cluster assembly protein SufD